MKDWWTIGELNVPHDKKDELNGYVIKLLDMCGIRKITTMQIAGRSINVLEKPCPDEHGIVRFDYSIFEKSKRKECWYDMNTCTLTLNDHGGNEFGLIMNSIMTLQECYSESHFYLMYKDKIVDYISGYLDILYELLGKVFYCPRRGKIWDILLFLHNNDVKNLEDMVFKLVYEVYSTGDVIDMPQISSGIHALHPISYDDHLSPITTKEVIADKRNSEKRQYLFRLFKTLIHKGSGEIERFLRILFESGIKDRLDMAKSSDLYGAVAEVSLYMLPAEMISIYATVNNNGFWNEWDRFNINPYSDTLIEPETQTTKPREVLMYIMRRDNKDEFLEFWDKQDLKLSDSLKRHISKWRLKIQRVGEIPESEIEQTLYGIIDDLYTLWRCRYVDKEFISLMLTNKSNPMYRKALALLKEIMSADVKYFPELPGKQATKWMICPYGDKYMRTIIMAYQSLLICKGKRAEILGF